MPACLLVGRWSFLWGRSSEEIVQVWSLRGLWHLPPLTDVQHAGLTLVGTELLASYLHPLQLWAFCRCLVLLYLFIYLLYVYTSQGLKAGHN